MVAVQQTYPGSELDALFPSLSSTPNILSPPQYPALYAVGVSGSLIEQFYEQDNAYQRLAVEPPEVVTEENFIEHPGDDNFYGAYKIFFRKRHARLLEEHIFSKKYNFIEGQDGSAQPVMFARFLGALFHAFIHVGHGAEMDIPCMVVEGLAMANVHEPAFLLSYLFDLSGTTAVEEATTRLASLLDTKTSITSCQLEQPPKTMLSPFLPRSCNIRNSRQRKSISIFTILTA
ncbi:hypothetical protein BDR07DRAFT_1613811 [Suillus spraguei]|nr:hypothetical protein BDR07DRAFT_1613811 [Suillus spraguei]